MLKEYEHMLLSIKDFSELSGIKQSTLRYYDDLGLFVPAVRRKSGYRYYTPQQLITINAIKVFTDLDVPIKVVSEIASNRTPKSVLDFIVGKEIEIEDQVRTLTRALNVARVFKRTINRGINIDENKISLEYLSEMPMTVGPENEFETSDETFYAPFMDYLLFAGERHINLSYPIGGLFNDFLEFEEGPNRPTHFFSIDPDGMRRRPAGMYLTTFEKGYYGNVSETPKKMKEFAEKENLLLKGPVYHIFLFDEISQMSAENYLSEISIAASPKLAKNEEED